MNNRGQIAIQTMITGAAFIGAIVAPTLWFGDIKQVNAVQDTRITTIETTNQEIRDNVEYIRRAVEQLSIKQGIQGVQGIQGATGAQGVQGVRGAPGVDAPTP